MDHVAGLDTSKYRHSSYDFSHSSGDDTPCDTVPHGYECNSSIAHFWG